MFRLLPALLLFALAIQNSPASVNLKINATAPGISGPVSVRAIIRQSNGSYVSGEWGSPGWPPITMRGKAMAPDTIVQVPTGQTTITVGKGPDFYPQTITTNLANDGQTYTINFSLKPVLNLYAQGWRGGEAHAHFFHGEGEISRTPTNTWAMASAGGLNFVSLCEDHLGSGSWTRQQMLDTWAVFENSECKMWIGVEEPKNAWGHNIALLYDPWEIRSSVPYHWGIHSIHQQGGVSIPVHTDRLFPGRYWDDSSSGARTWFLLPNNNHHKAYPLDALIGHLIDAWSGVSDEGSSAIKLPPYFKLLDMGYKIPFTADSDFCFDRVNNGGKSLGCWMTYYQLDGQPLTRASAINAIRKGRILATTGPLVTFSIDNALPGDTLPADGTARTVRIEASHTFNPWTLELANIPNNDVCRVKQIDLFRNGQVVKTWTPNTTNAVVTHTINESSTNAYYMVRVLGNDSGWMAAYASPIYFDNTVRPTHPPVFKPLVQGKLYDSASGNSLTGTVSCVRYGKTEWTIPTDSQGRFQAYVPLDAELVARDQNNREFTQNIIQHEPAYAFCHYLPDDYLNNMAGAVEPFRNLVQTMRWEFPMGYQPAASYVRTSLSGDAAMSSFTINSAPAATSGKSNTEIVMLIADKTRAQPGDTVNYAVIYRRPGGGTPTEALNVECKAWDPNRPRMYNKLGTSFHWNESTSGLINLGGGFYLRQGSFVVPSWTANATPTTAAVKFFVTVRANGKIIEEANLLIPTGTTKRELLVSTTSDGFPASWGERGIGPCNFFREWTFLVRYADYRTMSVSFNLNGQPITVRPTVDTAHCADADNAVLYDWFYYDGQCEPQYRNVPFRDPVRTQPAAVDFSSVPVKNPTDVTQPMVALIEPRNGDRVSAGAVPFYFAVDDSGLSGVSSATLYIDGQAVLNNVTACPAIVNLSQGTHTWQVKGRDRAGNEGSSEVRTLTVGSGGTSDTTRPNVSVTAPGNNATVSGAAVVVSASASDNVAVAGVQFQMDGVNFGSELYAAPYAQTWNTTASANGLYRLTAIARDAAGNRATSAVVNITVNNGGGGGTGTNSNALIPAGFIWVNDALPEGAVPASTGGDSWSWVSANPTPVLGGLAHASTGSGYQEHGFNHAWATMSVETGGVLFACIYLNPDNPPREIMLAWGDGSWDHRAYWGENLISYGTDGTAGRRYMGSCSHRGSVGTPGCPRDPGWP